MNNGYCNEATYSKNSKYLYTTGSDGKVFMWDLNMRKVVNCINDVGSNNSKSIDLSSNDAYLAVGSDQGHVNIYDVKQQNLQGKNNSKVELVKEVQNLTTSITGVQFNESNEILAIYSKWKRNAIRLMHLPTFTVFENWPNLRTNLSFVN